MPVVWSVLLFCIRDFWPASHYFWWKRLPWLPQLYYTHSSFFLETLCCLILKVQYIRNLQALLYISWILTYMVYVLLRLSDKLKTALSRAAQDCDQLIRSNSSSPSASNSTFSFNDVTPSPPVSSLGYLHGTSFGLKVLVYIWGYNIRSVHISFILITLYIYISPSLLFFSLCWDFFWFMRNKYQFCFSCNFRILSYVLVQQLASVIFWK